MFVLNLLFEVIFDVWCDMMFVGCVCVFEGIFELSCKCVDEFDMIFGEGGLLVCVFDGYWLCMLQIEMVCVVVFVMEVFVCWMFEFEIFEICKWLVCCFGDGDKMVGLVVDDVVVVELDNDVGDNMLIVEVGMGIGKIYVYLVFVMLWGGKVIVLIGMKYLQDQLFQCDILIVCNVFVVLVLVVMFKGCVNYLCYYYL